MEAGHSAMGFGLLTGALQYGRHQYEVSRQGTLYAGTQNRHKRARQHELHLTPWAYF